MGSYLHGDGTFQKYGTDKATPTKTGEYRTVGANRQIEIKGLDLTTLSTTRLIVGDVTLYPKNYIVESVEVWARTAATTGTSATLDVGTIATDRSTGGDADGIVAALAIADINADGDYALKSTVAAGALGVFADKDSVPTATGYITCSTTTGTYTAGVIDIRINLRPLV